MVGIDLRTAIRHWPQAVRNPRWGWVLATQGRTGLFREFVRSSLEAAGRAPIPASFEEIPRNPPCSPLGKVGGTQEYLFHLVRLLRPRTVVETGVFRGISSAFILSALSRNYLGKLYSIDLPQVAYQPP